ncbi:hypothetical protein HHK36_011442 [Tetracentron sinense]|uniref:Pentatricopeptide repeat-containing protein n=1 Tax=Tetracentron sinense TaxID=13715 RepID=A0A834ZAE3_TETSI|nr:hypothetical protein HHK36_011442 [Tetracentron sinense]
MASRKLLDGKDFVGVWRDGGIRAAKVGKVCHGGTIHAGVETDTLTQTSSSTYTPNVGLLIVLGGFLRGCTIKAYFYGIRFLIHILGMGRKKQLFIFLCRCKDEEPHKVNSPLSGTAVLEVYAKCSLIKVACQVFNRMPERSAVMWSLIR